MIECMSVPEEKREKKTFPGSLVWLVAFHGRSPISSLSLSLAGATCEQIKTHATRSKQTDHQCQ